MRFLTRLTVTATVTLVLAGCLDGPNDDGCNHTGNGLAGNGNFTYACTGPADPQCDAPTFGAEATMPTAVARGSEFDLRYGGRERPRPVSPKAVRDLGAGFEALAAGNVGFVVISGEEALDAFRLTVTEPDGLAISGSRENEGRWERWSAATSDQEVGIGKLWLRPLALAGSTTLAGSVTGVTWTVDPPDVAKIEPATGGTFMLETLRPGVVTIRLARGELFTLSRIQVIANPIDGGPDQDADAPDADLDAGGDQ